MIPILLQSPKAMGYIYDTTLIPNGPYITEFDNGYNMSLFMINTPKDIVINVLSLFA